MRGLKSRLWGKNPKKFGLHSARMCGLKSARELYLSWCAEVAFCTDAWIEIQTIGQFYFFVWVAFYVDKWIEIYLGYWVCYLLCECVDWNMSWLLRTYRLWELQIFAFVAQLLFIIKIDKTCPKLVYNIWYK